MKATTTAMAAIAAALFALPACSTTTPEAPVTVTTTVTPSATTPVPSPATVTPSAQPDDCVVNPSSAPVPTVGPYETVPEIGRVALTLSGIPTGTLTPGGPPTEVAVSLCNDSAVDYPTVGVVVMLSHCSCAPGPQIAQGTVERFDEAAGSWIQLSHAAVGAGMDYLGGYANVQPLPKGAAVRLRYRIALDASMTDGEGGVTAAAVIPEPLNQLGSADLAFAVAG